MTINSGGTPVRPGEDDMKAQRHHHLRPRGEKISHDASRPNLPSQFLETEIGQSRMVIRASSERPVIFAL